VVREGLGRSSREELESEGGHLEETHTDDGSLQKLKKVSFSIFDVFANSKSFSTTLAGQ
jgi:hypothetical protein